MGDFDGGGRRWVRITATLLAVAVVALSAGAAGVWIGRTGAASAEASPADGRGVGRADGPVMAGDDPGAGPGGRCRRRRAGLDDPESRCGRTVLGHRPGCAVRVPAGPGRGGAGRGERGGRRKVPGRNVCRSVVGVGVPRRPGVRRPRREPRPGGVLHRAGRSRGRRGVTTTGRRTGGGDPAGRRGPRRRGAGNGGARSRPVRCGPSVLWQSFSAEYRPDGQQGYTVRIAAVSVLLVWAAGDWKVAQVGGPPAGMDTVVLGVVPASFPVPAESWHR